jgi:hypothetical protein
MAAFEHARAQEIRDAFALSPERRTEVERCKDFVQIRTGPFDIDLFFAPDGIESFAEAWARRVDAEGFPVCHPDDIVRSKEAAGRARDGESLPRLRAFRDWWLARQRRSQVVRPILPTGERRPFCVGGVGDGSS